MYYLIRNPQHLERIREELASIDRRDYKAVQQLQHLNACIYETLRLNPAVPSAGLRIAPRGGLLIGDTHIPEGTTVVVPQYSLLRGKSSWSVKHVPSIDGLEQARGSERGTMLTLY